MNIETLNVETFSQQVTSLYNRLSFLYKDANQAVLQPAVFVPSVLKELGVAMEELQVALEEIQVQNEALTKTLENVTSERKHYHELFQFSPEAYLVTNLEGTIQEANRATAQLLGVPNQFLFGKPLSLFVHETDRPMFRAELLRRQQRDFFQDWTLNLQSRTGKTTTVTCLALAVRDGSDKPTHFRWVFRETLRTKQIPTSEQNDHEIEPNDSQLLQNRPLHLYSRGDVIPLDPQTLWYVDQGLVKLTTLTALNQELLTGLIGSSMVFGAYLTSLTLYEAIALSDVQLISFSVSEVMASQPLLQFFFKKGRQRLQQSEAILMMLGERHVGERLNRFLFLLEEVIGQPVEQGTRLSIRLTHEAIASACCTTRVTVSRLLSQLQQEGKITLDEKKHLVILNTFKMYTLLG
jgi:PAS domain S-box-containing protein